MFECRKDLARIITNGAQHAFDLLARVLIEPGARVAVEAPGYPCSRAGAGGPVGYVVAGKKGAGIGTLVGAAGAALCTGLLAQSGVLRGERPF
jgi:hypothetical protein